MRTQEMTIAQEINLSTPSIELGNNSIHDCYLLEVTLKAKNETGAAKTPTIAEWLSAIEQVAVMTDNTRYHYALNGKDIANLNAIRTPVGIPSRVLDMTFGSTADDATMEATFVLALDEGDIVALQHDSVTMKAAFAKTIATDCPVTYAQIKPSLVEDIPESTADITNKYGANFEAALEPKVYAKTQKCSANTEFTGFADLPTGCLLRGAMLDWSAAPEQFGILQVVPSRSELWRLNWATARAKDERLYRTKMPENVTMLNYNTEWVANGLGKDGRGFNRGDFQIAARSSVETTLRYISLEQTFPAGAGAVLATGNRFV